MAKLSTIPLLLALAALPFVLLDGGCVSEVTPSLGVCVYDSSVSCLVAPITGSVPQDAGLIPYSCTGKARPDQNAYYNDEIPQGYICADRGATADGKQGYCCAPDLTSCALDPGVRCTGNEAAFQCQGPSRPDVYNAALNCENGIHDGNDIDYCCTGQAQPPHCTVAGGCGEVLQGFSCPVGVLPKNEDLGANESRADYYRFFCPTPKPTPGGIVDLYCCYMPLPPQDGYSCYQDTTVPGCAAGRFGFACYGYDTPPEDYPPMNCPDPGFQGTSAEGYPATLYCCDFQNTATSPTL
jgi:hypothetical protein